MASRAKTLAAVLTTATCTGIGGYLFGISSKDRNRFQVNAQLKDVLSPSSFSSSSLSSQGKTTPPPSGSLASCKSPQDDGSAVANNNAGLLATTVGPHRITEIMQHGFPSVDHIRSRSDYVLAYDRKNRTALWVAEHLTADRLIRDRSRTSRNVSVFKEDQSIHPYFRSTNDDYMASGFDRGHLAAAGNHCINQESLDETFYLSNISPQVGEGFNRGAWNKLEQYTRAKTKSHANVFVMTGPLYIPSRLEDGKTYIKYQVLGTNHVAVPTHFFKALLCQTTTGEYHMECFVIPNKPIDAAVPLQAFLVPRDTVEREAGFLLFEGLPKAALKTLNGRRL